MVPWDADEGRTGEEMRLQRADREAAKGWYFGPWNSASAISVGYANKGIDEPHVHTRITEVYLVARGSAVMQVGQQTIMLEAGDVLVVEPGEAHTFLSSSAGYFHFVVHSPGLAGAEALAEKRPVLSRELGETRSR
ncbi:MAG: cupin domain-containing protein [Chloroflexi bacterium]|nr:cupin domain-containing protein [Chloroflexota bacterium]